MFKTHHFGFFEDHMSLKLTGHIFWFEIESIVN